MEGDLAVIQLGGKTFELKYDNKNGWNFEAFRDRYSDVLDRYDYIVGDWGYNQLRLKGFFREGNPKGSKESSIASLQEYIQEYCNFGCAYFVLERIPNKKRTDHPFGGQDEQQLEPKLKHQEGSKGQVKLRPDDSAKPSSKTPNKQVLSEHHTDAADAADKDMKPPVPHKVPGDRDQKPFRKRSGFRHDQQRQERSKNQHNNSKNA